MKFAVIGDIHGNKYALESVLEHINTKNVDFIVSTGDLVGYMPFPNEVIDLIRKNKVIAVQGNHDKFISESEKVSDELINTMTANQIQSNASAAFTNWNITDENRSYLRNLTKKLNLQCGDFKIVVVHGSPMEIDEYLYEDKEHLSRIAELINEDIVICGHTHVPYYTKVSNKHFINSGSVGKPKHGDGQSTYAILEIIDGKINCTIEKVTYAINLIVRDIEANSMISDKLIPMLQQGF